MIDCNWEVNFSSDECIMERTSKASLTKSLHCHQESTASGAETNSSLAPFSASILLPCRKGHWMKSIIHNSSVSDCVSTQHQRRGSCLWIWEEIRARVKEMEYESWWNKRPQSITLREGICLHQCLPKMLPWGPGWALLHVPTGSEPFLTDKIPHS